MNLVVKLKIFLYNTAFYVDQKERVMYTLNGEHVGYIGGGNYLVAGANAVVIGAGVFAAPQMIHDGAVFLGGVGSSVGEWTYNLVNPNPLGQMEYTPDQFGYSYIAPADPNY